MPLRSMVSVMSGSGLSLRARRAGAASALAVALVLSGCAAVPADADGTLDRVRGGELRVGITHNPPWTDTSGAPAGTEVQLVERLAAELDADIAWTHSSEAQLAEALRRGELDLAVGGFTDDTPWTDRAALTEPYTEAEDAAGETRKHVMLTRPGENGMLVAVERFLRAEGTTP